MQKLFGGYLKKITFFPQDPPSAKGPGPAQAERSTWGGESTHVDLDLKNSAEEWARVTS
jgi:hypothetical protein